MYALNQAYAANQYAGMSPGRIVLAMFEGALSALERARMALEKKEVAPRGEAIGKALAIIGELQSSLNMEKGGEIAERLFALYDYIFQELIRANLKADPVALENAMKIVRDLADAWEQMLGSMKAPSEEVAPPPPPPPPVEKNEERTNYFTGRKYL